MNMPKSRDIQAKMPSPKVILHAFWHVTVKVLNSYVYIRLMRRREVRSVSFESKRYGSLLFLREQRAKVHACMRPWRLPR